MGFNETKSFSKPIKNQAKFVKKVTPPASAKLYKEQ